MDTCAWTPMDAYLGRFFAGATWTTYGHLCLDTYAWTPMLATATGNRDKDPTLNRFPEMDVYGTVLALKDVENRTVWGPRAGIIDTGVMQD